MPEDSWVDSIVPARARVYIVGGTNEYTVHTYYTHKSYYNNFVTLSDRFLALFAL